MIALTAFLSSLRGSLRSTWTWLWAGAALLLWSSFTVFGPLGLTTSTPDTGSALYEVAFLSLLGGNLQGLHQIQRLQWLLEAHPGRPRLELLVGTLLGASLLFLAAGLAPPVMAGLLLDRPLPMTPPDGLVLLRAWFLMAALASSLRLLPWAPSSAALALVGSTWVLPALLHGRGALATWMAHCFQAVPALTGDGSSPRVLSGSEWKLLLGPIIGWIALACLLADGRRRAKHALRNPG